MTRFKELRRIERAIEYRDRVDLEWAAEYCRLRLSYVRTKEGAKMWRKLEKRVKAALSQG
jgi:hypothetical protein